jgi:hypothetical protein
MTRTKFRKGMKVTKVLHGLNGSIERADYLVGRVSKGVVYLTDGVNGIETGITYDLNGMERERFFLPMWSEIVPTPASSPEETPARRRRSV